MANARAAAKVKQSLFLKPVMPLKLKCMLSIKTFDVSDNCGGCGKLAERHIIRNRDA